MRILHSSIYGSFLLILFLILGPFGCAPPVTVATPDLIEPVSGMEFAFVKGGTFKMGSNVSPEEKPIHSVMVQDLFVGMHEVTFAQYDQYCVATDCKLPDDQDWGRGTRPVINVSWHDAVAYAAWLNEQTDLNFRLPTEAEWEYFARAGKDTPFWTGRKFPKNYANCSDCGSQWNYMTAPVGSFPANPWKIFDTTGNVLEWVQDDYLENYQNAPIDGTPVISGSSNTKSLRGGSWRYNINDMRAPARDSAPADNYNTKIGFRLVLPGANLNAVKTAK